MPQMTRRDAMAGLAAPLIVPSRVLAGRGTAPSDRISLGIIGSGGRAALESSFWVRSPDCEVAAICDVQESRRDSCRAMLEKSYTEQRPGYSRRGIRLYRDFRELLRQPDVDAVYIATQDHWHVPITIAALQAGKHCHTEKPLGISIEMDLAAQRAVRKFGKSFLIGAERRSDPDARHALELVLNGRIGKVESILVVCPPSLSGGSATPVLPVPKGWDWDMWVGPAPAAPFCQDRATGFFHIRDYCLGMIANWGAHPLDQVQFWAEQVGIGMPVTYEGEGKIAEGGLFNCVTNWDVRCTYENGLVIRYMDNETYAAATDVPKVATAPNRKLADVAMFVGSEGYVASSYTRVVTKPESLITSVIGPTEQRLPGAWAPMELVPPNLALWQRPAACHQLGWIAYLKSQRTAKSPVPTVDPIDSAVSTDLICQLSEICVRTGRKIRWDPKRQTIVGDRNAAKLAVVPMREPWASLVRKTA